MIAVDTNILVYAHREDSPFLQTAKSCVRDLAENARSWAIPWPCIHQFFAIATHPRIYTPPSTTAQAIKQLNAWFASTSLVMLGETATYWEMLKAQLQAGKVVGLHGLLVACLIAIVAAPSFAASTTTVPKDGFLCCNLRVSGAWASDANNQRSGGTVIPAGTRVIGMAYGSSQVDVEIGGKKVSIGNDYSRDMSIQAFAQRWIVAKDPREALRDWSPKAQQAVKAGRVMKGMNRKQVLMSLGWPNTGSTPNIDDPVWNYPAGFKVIFNERWAVKAIDADDTVKKLVVMP